MNLHLLELLKLLLLTEETRDLNFTEILKEALNVFRFKKNFFLTGCSNTKLSFLELSHWTCKLSLCLLEVLASRGGSCEVRLSLWVGVSHHTAFTGGLESLQCGHREWAVFTQWWQDAPGMDGCLTSVPRTGSTSFYILSTQEAAPSFSLPR